MLRRGGLQLKPPTVEPIHHSSFMYSCGLLFLCSEILNLALANVLWWIGEPRLAQRCLVSGWTEVSTRLLPSSFCENASFFKMQKMLKVSYLLCIRSNKPCISKRQSLTRITPHLMKPCSGCLFILKTSTKASSCIPSVWAPVVVHATPPRLRAFVCYDLFQMVFCQL